MLVNASAILLLLCLKIVRQLGATALPNEILANLNHPNVSSTSATQMPECCCLVVCEILGQSLPPAHWTVIAKSPAS